MRWGGILENRDIGQVLGDLAVSFAVQALWDRKVQGLADVLLGTACKAGSLWSAAVKLSWMFLRKQHLKQSEAGSPGLLVLSSLVSGPFSLKTHKFDKLSTFVFY